MKILVVGYGEIANNFAQQNSSFSFTGLRRTDVKGSENVNIIVCDYLKGLPEIKNQSSYDWLLFFPKISTGSPESYEDAYISKLNEVEKRFPTCKKIFISSTRVYLNHQNEIVDENLPLKPSDQQGNIIQKYEKTILENDNNQILRLSGLITEQSNFVRKVIREKLFTDNKYINAIHIDDVLNILRDMIEEKLTAKVINGVMPLTTMYSDFDSAFKGSPVNAAVKSIHYNDEAKFKIKTIKELA